MKISKNFDDQEFACKHCKQVKVDPRLIVKLQALRDFVGKPITINSGFRCPIHNKAIGGAKDSFHMKGMAADISIEGFSPVEVAYLAMVAGFNGLGIYDNFTHVDVRLSRSRWVETKDKLTIELKF